MLYTVGETAKIVGVAPSTLRYYDKEGLLPFVERSTGGIRVFKESDFEWLKIIGCLKNTGMSIKEIGKFIDWCMEGDRTIEKRLELIDRQREKVMEEIKSAQETLLTALEQACGSCDSLCEEYAHSDENAEAVLQTIPTELLARLRKRGLCLRQLARHLVKGDTVYEV